MKQFIIPYIIFKDCQEAANYYKEIFNGEVIYIMKGKDTPNCPKDQLEKTMHLELKFNNTLIYMADGENTSGDNINLLLDYTNLVEMTKAYNKMERESEILQELKESFWGAIFGVVKDKYNITWEFHYSVPKE